MFRSLALLVALGMCGVAVAQDLQFVRTWSRPEASATTMSVAARVPTDNGYVLFKVGAFGSELSRYNNEGELIASQRVTTPFESVPVNAAVAVDSGGNTFLAYSAPALGFNQVVLERYNPVMVRLGRVIPTANGLDAGSIQLQADGTNAYLAFRAGSVAFVSAYSSTLTTVWSNTVDFINSVNCIAVGNNRVLVGMGFGPAPYLASYVQTDGTEAFKAPLFGSGGTTTANRVNRIECSPGGTAYMVLQVADTSTRLVEYGIQDDIIYGPTRANTNPDLLTLVGGTKLFWGGNTPDGWAILRSDQGNMDVEDARAEQTAERLSQIIADPINGLVWLLGRTGVPGSEGFTKAIDASLLDILGRDTPGAILSHLTQLSPGRFVASGGSGTVFHQGLAHPATPSLWKITETPILPTTHNPRGMVIDASNNAYVLEQTPTRARLLKYDPSGVLQWVQPVYQVADVRETLASGIAIGPDGKPVVCYSTADTGPHASFIVKFNADGSRVFDRLTANSLVMVDVTVGADNTVYGVYSLDGIPFICKINKDTGAVEQFYAEVNLTTARAIRVTPTGYVITVGTVNGASAWAVRNPAGQQHWAFSDPGVSPNLEDMALQSNGLVAIAFRQRNSTDSTFRFRVFRIDPIRKLVMMTSTLNGTTTEPSFDVATSPAGTIYLAQAGASKGLVQYNTSGGVAWVRTLPSGVSRVVQCVTDVQNSVYVLAEETYPVAQGGSAKGWYFAKYNTLGNLVTQRRFQGQIGLDGSPALIAIGRVFDIWVAGNMQLPGQGFANTVLRYLQPVPPTVVGDNYQISQGMTFSDNVLTNDSDLNGDALTAQIVSNPSGGTLTLAPNGNFTYTAPNNFLGIISFKYRAVDSTGRSTIGQCNFEIVP